MAKCKNCINLDRQGWCEKAVDSPEPNRERECYYFQHMTNADRIRAMNDEELADRIMGYVRCDACEKEFHIECNPLMTCRGVWLEWLKKEVDDG